MHLLRRLLMLALYAGSCLAADAELEVSSPLKYAQRGAGDSGDPPAHRARRHCW